MKKIVVILCTVALCLTAFLPVFNFSAKAASATTQSSNEYVSSSSNYDKLRTFINTYGEAGSSGKSITIDVPTSQGTISYILANWSNGIGVIMHLTTDNPYSVYRTSFELTKSSKMIEIDHTITVISLPSDSASNTIIIDRSLHTNDSKYSLTNAGKYMSLADINSVFNSSLSKLLADFDKFLYDNLGFGFGGLGFVSYIGYGDVACDIPSDYHGKKTEYVSNGDGTHDCVCEGCGDSSVANCTFKTTWESSSSQHWHTCSVCGGADTKVDHDYDNSCDTTCNTCGYTRQIQTTPDSTTAPDTTKPSVTVPDTTDSGNASGTTPAPSPDTNDSVVSSIAILGVVTALALILKKKK